MSLNVTQPPVTAARMLRHLCLKGSEEETRDVIAAYEKAMGNMRTVTDSVLLATAGKSVAEHSSRSDAG